MYNQDLQDKILGRLSLLKWDKGMSSTSLEILYSLMEILSEDGISEFNKNLILLEERAKKSKTHFTIKYLYNSIMYMVEPIIRQHKLQKIK